MKSTLTSIEFGILLLCSLFGVIFAAQPRLIETKRTYPSFTEERSVQAKSGLPWPTNLFSKLDTELSESRLHNCVSRLAAGQNQSESVHNIKFLTYRFRAQWPTPNSPVLDYTTQYPTYLFSLQVNQDDEFWHLKVIDLNRCCKDIWKESAGQNLTTLTDHRIVGLLGQKKRNWELEDFGVNDCPLQSKQLKKKEKVYGKAL